MKMRTHKRAPGAFVPYTGGADRSGGPPEGVDTRVGVPKSCASRGPHQIEEREPSVGVGTEAGAPDPGYERPGGQANRGPRFLYFCIGPVVYRQEVLKARSDGDLVLGHRELLHTGGLIVDRVAAAEAAGVPLDDLVALADFANRSGTTERYILSRILRIPESYEDCWVHVAPHECRGCRACEEAVRAGVAGAG